MSKVTSKLQVTVPKAIAGQYGIRPGDELDWLPAGDSIRAIPRAPKRPGTAGVDVEERLKLFHQMLARQRAREREARRPKRKAVRTKESAWKPHEIERGWRREDLYTRGFPR
jgi:AbrB family looped-hinge helix DNA binding protein